MSRNFGMFHSEGQAPSFEELQREFHQRGHTALLRRGVEIHQLGKANKYTADNQTVLGWVSSMARICQVLMENGIDHARAQAEGYGDPSSSSDFGKMFGGSVPGGVPPAGASGANHGAMPGGMPGGMPGSMPGSMPGCVGGGGYGGHGYGGHYGGHGPISTMGGMLGYGMPGMGMPGLGSRSGYHGMHPGAGMHMPGMRHGKMPSMHPGMGSAYSRPQGYGYGASLYDAHPGYGSMHEFEGDEDEEGEFYSGHGGGYSGFNGFDGFPPGARSGTPGPDLYAALGVSRTAPQSEIDKAAKKLKAQWHPDRNKAKNAEEKFKEVNEASEWLCDAEKRMYYDMMGRAVGSEFKDWKEMMGGRRRRFDIWDR